MLDWASSVAWDSRWRVGQCREETLESWASLELGARDSIVDVDVGVRDSPALGDGKGPGILHLACDRLRLVGDELVGGFASVDSGVHFFPFGATGVDGAAGGVLTAIFSDAALAASNDGWF